MNGRASRRGHGPAKTGRINPDHRGAQLFVVKRLSATLRFWRETLHQDSLSNMRWLALEKVFRLGINFFVLGQVARHLGPESFGHLSFGLYLLAIVQPLASLGLDQFTVADLVREPGRTRALLAHVMRLRLLASLGAAMLFAGVGLWTAESGPEQALILALTAGVLTLPLDSANLWYQAALLGKKQITFQLLGLAVFATLKLSLNAPLFWFGIAFVGEAAFTNLLLWVWLRQHVPVVQGAGVPPHWTREALRVSAPLVVSTLLGALYFRADQFLVDSLLGAAALGVYAAAFRMFEVMLSIGFIFGNSLYPKVVSSRGDAPLYRQRMLGCYQLMLLPPFVFIVFVALFGDVVIGAVFGPQYTAASGALLVLACSGIFHYMSHVRAQWMTLERLNRFHIPNSLIGMAVNFSVGWALIPHYGLIGAALGNTVGVIAKEYLTSWLFPALRPAAVLQTRALLFRREGA